MKSLASVIALMFLIGCASTQYYDENSFSKAATVLGMVYDADRKPVAGVKVVLETPLTGEAVTDIRGHFALGKVAFGPVKLSYTKDGYEPAALSFTFSEPSQVTYIQMTNRDQLFEATLIAIEAGNFADAEGFLTRSEAFPPLTATHVFLRATLFSARRQHADAVKVIEDWLSVNPDQLTLEVLLADLWEKSLNKPDKALAALQRALVMKNDPVLRRRVEALQTLISR